MESEIDVVLISNCYNIVEQGALELLPVCKERKVAVLNAGVFASGILASNRKKMAGYRYAKAPPAVRRKVESFWTLCKKHGVSRHAAALQFAAAPPEVTSLLVGAVSARQLRDNIAALSAPIPGEFWDELATVCGIPQEAQLPHRRA